MSKPSTVLSLVVAAFVAFVLCARDAAAQTCPNGSDVFYKNDVFPQVPAGGLPVAIVPGLCEGEAAGAVFTLSGPGPQRLTQVACPFTSPTGLGLSATVNLVVYDNVTFNGAGVPQMGNVVFDLVNATGNELQVFEGGINTFDVSSYNILVSGPKFVVAFFMNFNPNGNCTSGFTSNFFTDNTPCVAQKNLIYIEGQGWVDSQKANVFGIPLCGLFYKGNWVIRCCAEPNTNPYFVSVIGSPALPGQFVNLVFNAPGYQGKLYVAAAALTANTGIPLPPHGTFPLDYDVLLEYTLLSGGGGLFFNFIGTVGPLGTAPGLVLLPPTVNPGLQFRVAFVAFDPANPSAPWAISDAATVQVQ
jgi:hypothetical protein